MPGQVTFIELGVSNGTKARDFFQKVFGWSYEDRGNDNFLIKSEPVQCGIHPGDARASFVPYFEVADLEAAAARVRELGGEAGKLGQEEPGFGRFVECRDNQGVVFGLHQRSPRS